VNHRIRLLPTAVPAWADPAACSTAANATPGSAAIAWRRAWTSRGRQATVGT